MSEIVLKLANILIHSAMELIAALMNTPAKFILIAVIAVPAFIIISKLFSLLNSKSSVYIRDIDNMGGEEFEIYLESLFKKYKYHVERTQYSGDYGADLILHRDGMKTIVQAKRWSNKVGVKGVQEVVAARGHYRADLALLVTNSYLTKQAHNLAKSNNVEIWDRDKLLKVIAKA